MLLVLFWLPMRRMARDTYRSMNDERARVRSVGCLRYEVRQFSFLPSHTTPSHLAFHSFRGGE